MTSEVENAMMNHKNPNPQVYRFGHMKNETRVLWDNFYAPYNRQLAELLSDASYLWNT